MSFPPAPTLSPRNTPRAGRTPTDPRDAVASGEATLPPSTPCPTAQHLNRLGRPPDTPFAAIDGHWQGIDQALDALCIERMNRAFVARTQQACCVIPELQQLCAADFAAPILLALLRRSWHSAPLPEDAQALRSLLERCRANRCPDAPSRARFDNTVRKALVALLERHLPGFAERYLRVMEIARLESPAAAVIVMRKLLRSEALGFERALLQATPGVRAADADNWTSLLAAATHRIALMPVVAFLKTFVEAEELAEAAHRDTLHLLRHPEQAGTTDAWGEGACCLAALIGALEQVALGLRAYRQDDMPRFREAFESLLPEAGTDAQPIVQEPDDDKQDGGVPGAFRSGSSVLIEELDATDDGPPAAR